MINGIDITAEELDSLVTRYRAGDDSCRGDLILAHIDTAQVTAIHYYMKYPNKYFDIISSAYLGLCQAVTWAQKKLVDNNITPYIIVTIRRFISEYIDDDSLIRIPRSAIRKMLKLNDDEIEAMFPKTIDNIDVKNQADKPQFYIDVYEVINRLGLTNREKQILKLRVQGFTYREIGDELQIDHAWIARKIYSIRIKAKKYIGE